MAATGPGASRPTDRPPYDPVYLNARREAGLIFLVFLAALAWSVPYSYVYGYLPRLDPLQLTTIVGIPSWLFWGIGVPWLVANAVTVWFCFFWMRDDDLGASDDEPDEAAREEDASG